MKIQNRLKALLLSANIEYHWRRILRHRKKGCKLLDEGVSLSSERILRLNRRIMRHSLLAAKQEKFYETHFVPPVRGNI